MPQDGLRVRDEIKAELVDCTPKDETTHANERPPDEKPPDMTSASERPPTQEPDPA